MGVLLDSGLGDFHIEVVSGLISITLYPKGDPMPIPIIDPSQATTNESSARFEAIVEQLIQTLVRVEDRITRVEDRIARLEDRIAKVEDHMNKSFRWLVGILFTILIAILGATVTILLNMPK